ncbi:MAG: bifunctional phosphopantothenoylcysteine decarboxylase/phosphopantothenate--cysteine ligase CoaBC [Spirulinaceae cyanobacterium]
MLKTPSEWLRGKRILLGIGGGIAAYKVCTLISQLFQAGAEVRVVLTSAAEEFVTPLTASTLSRHRAYRDEDFWQPLYERPLHIELGEWAEIILIAPLTANTLAKLNYGLADNLLTNIILASTCPILLAPAMNTEMWEQATVQRNWQQLTQEKRYLSLSPNSGLLACDRVGAGRMAEPEEIFTAIQCLLPKGKRDLVGKSILISAGGTREYLDPVRFLGNPSTGKMGLALAQAAFYRGAEVTLVHGPMGQELLTHLPQQVQTVAVVSAEDMQTAMLAAFQQADWIVMAAAVADVKPADYSSEKLPKKALPSSLPLNPVPDIVAELGQQKKPQQKLIGFAAQTGDIVTPAWEKLQKKKLDVIVANPIDKPEAGFAGDANQGMILTAEGKKQTIPLCSKLALACQLWNFLLDV